MKKIGKHQGVSNFIYWTPRILGILFILFLALFSFDVFESCSGLLECALALLIHNIPSLILLAILIISWKKEIVGAITFILAGLVYISLIVMDALKNQFEWYMVAWVIQISGIAFFIGILFWLNWKRKKKR